MSYAIAVAIIVTAGAGHLGLTLIDWLAAKGDK